MFHNRARVSAGIAMLCLVYFALQGNDSFAGQASATAGAAVIEKPAARTVPGSYCIIVGPTFEASWGPAELPVLAFVIGPTPANVMHADKSPFDGPGVYKNVEIVVQLGNTVFEDRHDELGTVTVNADRRSGNFALNDGSAAGRWTCGFSDLKIP